MSQYHGNEIVEALSLIGKVHNCNMLNGDDPEIEDHYDCEADVKRAIEILTNIIEDRTAIKVYFERNLHAQHIATFYDGHTYTNCLPQLQKEAKKMGYDKVTESES